MPDVTVKQMGDFDAVFGGGMRRVRAGLGVTVLPQSLVPQDLVHVPAASGLPELPEIDFVLLDNPTGARGPADALSAAILDRPATTTGVGYEPARSAGR